MSNTVQKPLHRRPWLTMARYRVIVMSLSGGSAVFVLGVVAGLGLAR